MGISYATANLLIKAKNNHICFDNILTIGRLDLNIETCDIKHLGKYAGGSDKLGKNILSSLKDANIFLKIFLGAKSIQSLDYSDYEGADIIHDMNWPIDSRYDENFDVVIDGGSLEHIFNFPIAIANCMRMLKKGGSIFTINPASNHLGHGFYQFSPELFFRIFQPLNGFKIQDVILAEHPFPGFELSPRIECYSVSDPAVLKSRVGLVSKHPVSIMVHAVRTDLVPLFSVYPIQSDYQMIYHAKHRNESKQNRSSFIKTFFKLLIKTISRYIPVRFRNNLKGKRQLLNYSFSNRQFYKKWDLL
ncbi:MAG: hypothetical protein PHN49_10625 [Candidatus Omnitrophica bacterium]|nr:hypothetical protein [Candidatus Omnitrophota bacterium]MDD5672084.1 hypothetical protein [Candidatus Omnitrophota bacterium]